MPIRIYPQIQSILYFLLHFQRRKNIAVIMLLIRPLGVEPRIAGYKPGATNRITLGAHKR